MGVLLVGLAAIAAGGLAALAANDTKWSPRIGVTGIVIGSLLGLCSSVRALLTGAGQTMHVSWQMPFGAISVENDALSALFLIAIFALSALAALYGLGYLKGHNERKQGAIWFWYSVLVASMAGVVIARNVLLFLMTWELMSLSSFFLVAHDSDDKKTRRAAWIYLLATHIGTAFLFVMFLTLGARAGSLEFSAFAKTTLPPATAGLMFLFALIGFGTKAGMMPLHIWLPEAHPAAPSHVSALMSGVMVKTGIYGIIRMLTYFGRPPTSWGWMLIAIGALSGIMGILFALSKQDLKRMLAYSTVEHVGIIFLGLGIGLIGQSIGSPIVTAVGFSGALLHILNHAFFKGLMFLGAGAVQHATGTRELDRLGGLLKKMPWTGACFLIGSIAICGLPPFNGFISEFIIYVGSYLCLNTAVTSSVWAGIAVIAALALIGGFAIAAFTKAFGVAFLGEPRTDDARRAHENGPSMLVPMAILAAACIAIGAAAQYVLRAISTAVSVATGLPPEAIMHATLKVNEPLRIVVLLGGVFLAVLLALALIRKFLLTGRTVAKTVTWDCGYAKPTTRMQYTASSFAQPLVDLFATAIGVRRKLTPPDGILPSAPGTFHSETSDTFHAKIFDPIFTWMTRGMERSRRIQHGRLQLYVLYIALMLLILIVWQMWGVQ